MKTFKIIGFLVVAVFVAIQFIRSPKNADSQPPLHGIAQAFDVPDSVQTILRRSCYDCHSNNTVYPWYAYVEPIGWWLNSHIQNGKRHVDYDEYGTYLPVRQFVRFRNIIEQIQNDEMPLPSYLLIHRYARMTPAEKSLIIRWSTAMIDSMRVKYPPDSLRFRPRKEHGIVRESSRRDG